MPSGAFVARRNGRIFVTGNSGFPKSHDISKAIDKAAGAEREVVGRADPRGKYDGSNRVPVQRFNEDGSTFGVRKALTLAPLTTPATDAAKQWQGWGTALKPAVEIIVMARKPLIGTVAANVQAWGTGGINVDACRIPANGEALARPFNEANNTTFGKYARFGNPVEPQGRWPANLLLDPEAAALLDEMSGERPTGKPTAGSKPTTTNAYGQYAQRSLNGGGDTGGASRFFARFAHDEDDAPLRFAYIPKASRKDRNSDGAVNNIHPTCKPQKLMQWLARLCTPPNGTILDPFLGSGTTGVAAMLEGFNFIGIELDAEYLEIARRRIEHAQGQAAQPPAHMPQLPLLEMTGD